MIKRIAILGSTGSIGKQCLDVISKFPDKFVVEVLTANSNADLLIEQAKIFQPNAIVIGEKEKYNKVFSALEGTNIKIFAGKESIAQIVSMDDIDIVLSATVGFSGLLPTIEAIRSGKIIALANKETLVVAGELITNLCIENNVNLIPVDSEHSAIFQCLVGELDNPVEKIYLTASGGPFRGKDTNFLKNVTKEQALNHPNWDMGDKITIDSATLMNKGLEVIEARWLFNLKPEQIEVIVHPQSIIHSIVQFSDGSMKAQMGLPDMKLPILYALTYPDRLKSDFDRFSFLDYPNLTFEPPDTKIFRNLALSFEVLKMGGNAPCILNAANEIVVKAFLENKIGFMGMTDIVERTIKEMQHIKSPDINELLDTDREARDLALSCI